MCTVIKAINVVAFMALFFDYGVAMRPPESGGTRRLLQMCAKQLPTGAVAGFHWLPEPDYADPPGFGSA
ncbi:hypothetical protein J2Z17_001828 [Rhizobium halophytocola]|uniref:Uncharacterized protein n=1 Tax=Rhizobium halophytocola TaxID=735519 RepID=A0ABS4DXH6_9HYPH|nr:hypothetical protein [Rhizobium halophytocola]